MTCFENLLKLDGTRVNLGHPKSPLPLPMIRMIALVNEFTGLYVWVIPGISGYRLY
jgi:hypothetical protein